MLAGKCMHLPVYYTNLQPSRHITSTFGSIGAALAVSKILGLSPTKTTHAIGLAATQVTDLREMFGSHCKSFHVGRTAQNGLIAAVMAEGGYPAVGSRANPLSDEKLQQKFMDGCNSVSIRDAEAVSQRCWALEDLDDIRELVKHP